MTVALLAGCVDQLPARVVRLSLPDPPAAFPDATAITTPVPIPQPAAGQVRVHLQLPDEGDLSWDGAALAYPPGTRADRVEWSETEIVDVRGTVLEEGERRHHLYRAVPGGGLIGVSWPADDEQLRHVALGDLVRRLARAGVARAEQVRDKADCNGCHSIDRPPNRRLREHGLVNRGTDHAGFFTPSALFVDEVPLEIYGTTPIDDRFVSVRCRDDAAPEDGRCGDEPAYARYAWDEAIAESDPHASAVCASRQRLAARIEPPPAERCPP